MDLAFLERRRDPRTQAFLPITLRLEDRDEESPARLLDLSAGGAGLLMASRDAPAIGSFVEIRFESANTDGGSESAHRREVAIVVSTRDHESGLRRIGLRFLQHPDLGCGLIDPIPLLSDHRKWTTSRHPQIPPWTPPPFKRPRAIRRQTIAVN